MKVIKRSGTTQEYDGKKITSAMQKAFDSVGQTCRQEVLRDLLSQVEQNLGEGPHTVEAIQDMVERILMANGYYDVAKSYILYRQKRTELRSARMELADAVKEEGFGKILLEIQRDFPENMGCTCCTINFPVFGRVI